MSIQDLYKELKRERDVQIGALFIEWIVFELKLLTLKDQEEQLDEYFDSNLNEAFYEYVNERKKE